jgi:hypothetical protein
LPELKSRRNGRALCIVLISALAITLFSGCTFLTKARDKIAGNGPSVENTALDMNALTDEIVEGLKQGESEIMIFTTATEKELVSLADNMTPFWGKAEKYNILSTYEDKDIEGDDSDKKYDLMKVRITLKQSVNYYVYKAYKDPAFEIPASQKRAGEVLNVLHAAVAEIYGSADSSAGETEYQQVLAAHDWLAAKITYDSDVTETSEQNGSYGALVDKKTMCQGYAEALQLILLCRTNVESEIIVGDAANEDDVWVGHAWNIVKMDGAWYHVDATFDDPIGNPEGEVKHFYMGQNDAFMATNHKWNEAFWPKAEAQDFLYYRKNDAYADGQGAFTALITRKITEGNPTTLEVAGRDINLGDDSFQFIFDVDPAVSSIYRSVTKIGTATICDLDLEYS